MDRSGIPSLTGLRAVAALWVLGYHLRPVLHQLFPGYDGQLLSDGYLGVDVFFVLSGFILALNYGGRVTSGRDYGLFLGYRVARIYPLHLVVLLGMVALAVAADGLGLHVREEERFALDYHLPLHLTMTHAWGFEESLRFNQPSWSISAEFFAYLLFPAFWWIASRVDRKTGLVVMATAASFGGVLVLRHALGHEDLHVATHHALVRVSGAFLAGVAVYRLFEARAEAAPPSTAAGGLAVAAVVGVAVSPWADWLMPVAACLLVYVLARGAGPAGRTLETRPVLWLGAISYSIYLLHLPVFSFLSRTLPRSAELPALTRAGIAAAHVLLAIAVAAGAYYAVELPARRWIRGAVQRRLRTPPPAATPLAPATSGPSPRD